MLLLRVLLLSLFAITAVVAAGVAPGDEERTCITLRSTGTLPTPNYDPTMRVLMDSWYYVNLLGNRPGVVWQQVDNDTNNPQELTTNWIQNSNVPCVQTIQVCGFSAGMQNNWLITQLINRTVNGTLLPQVSVLIEFELQGCDVTLNCQRTFNTHVLEMSVVDPGAARNITNYRQVSRVSPDVATGDRVNETVHINFNTGNSSFYFAIQDETTCIVVTRVLVFYSVCPKQTSDLIHHPEILAPRVGGTPMPVTASCVENATTDNNQPPIVFCSSGGIWTKSSRGCQCLRGHGVNGVNSAGTCSPCRVGTYSSRSNGSCSSCPANSFSDRQGLAECTCDSGYFRASGEEDLPCREPPPSPRVVKVVAMTESSITIEWDPPPNIRADNLTYRVFTSLNGIFSEVMDVDTTSRRVTIENLRSGQSYQVYVITSNSLTANAELSALTAVAGSVQITTAGAAVDPGLVIGVSVSAVVAVIIIVVIVLVVLFLAWVYHKVNDDGGKQLYAQYQTVVELTQQTGRQMYVDPSIYATADEAVKDFTMEIAPRHLSIKEEIGRGEFGAVYKGIWKNSGKSVPIAIKTLKPNSSAKQRNDFLSEASIMGQFNHPNVVKLYGVVTKVEPVMIIMEFLENGSLFYYLRANDEKLGVQRLLKMAKGVAVGMDYLSTIGFVHRDLAARNVLVSKNETCKVADFGLSRETVDDIYKVNKGGKIPVRWTAPEAIYRRKFTTSSDVWSFGVLFWEILTYGQNPYDDMDNQELLDKIDDGYRLEKPDKTPDEVYQLMLDCWDEDNIKRPVFALIAQRLDELLVKLNDKNVTAPKKVSKTYSYSSSVVTSPLDYETVDDWLDGLKMGAYKENFKQRGISTTNEVLALDEEHLRKMDITLKGHISKIVRSIAIGNQKLGREPSMRI